MLSFAMNTYALPLYQKTFQKVVENFTCDRCHQTVVGDGYRNHCPNCLQSKHVDINPGDRAAGCEGAMLVVDIVLEHGTYILTHQCVKCNYQKRNKAHEEDSTDALIEAMVALAA